MQGQRHLRTHAGEAGAKEGAAIEPNGSRRADLGFGWPDPATTGERVAIDHHRHNREWTRVAAARVSEMPEPPHRVQWH
jgi:hypothetical protein